MAVESTDGWHDDVGVIGRRVGVPVTVAVVVLTALTTVAGLLITKVLDGSLGRVDLDLANALVDRRTPTLNEVTGAATVLADSFTVAVLWIAAMAVGRVRTRSWQLPIFFLAAIGGEKLTYLLASIAVARPRPPVESLGHVFATNSFPSGHVGAALTLYGGIAVAVLWHRRRSSVGMTSGAAIAVAAVVALVGFSRMSRGHHFLTDVAWGAFLGATWLVLAHRLVLRR